MHLLEYMRDAGIVPGWFYRQSNVMDGFAFLHISKNHRWYLYSLFSFIDTVHARRC